MSCGNSLKKLSGKKITWKFYEQFYYNEKYFNTDLKSTSFQEGGGPSKNIIIQLQKLL